MGDHPHFEQWAHDLKFLCAKHDKVFTEDHPCPGCTTELAGGNTVTSPLVASKPPATQEAL
jgi:hypothetical protein